MKVLHIGVGNMYGGIESHLVCLARSRALSPEMETAFAVCFEGRLKDELCASGAAVLMLSPMRASRPWSVWRARRVLRGVLERERFDAVIIHAPWAYALLGSAVRKNGAKLFLWCHAAPREQRAMSFIAPYRRRMSATRSMYALKSVPR